MNLISVDSKKVISITNKTIATKVTETKRRINANVLKNEIKKGLVESKKIEVKTSKIELTRPDSTTRKTKNINGVILGVEASGSVNVINLTVGSRYVIRGFQGFGSGDTTFTLKVNGQIQSVFSTSILVKNADVSFPTPILVETNGLVVLEAQNISLDSINITAVLFGEELNG